MIRRFGYAFLLSATAAGAVAGCGPKPPEVKLDPALANKPFPKAEIPKGQKPAPAAAFPGVGGMRIGP